MRSRPLTFACAALLSASAWAQPHELPLAKEALLHSARAWEARDRGDLARLALEKLVTARPNSPEALLELGELQLRMGEFAAADHTLRTLRDRFPESSSTRTLETAHRFATRDRLKLASVQRLMQIKRFTDAKKSLNDLFPQGPPPGTLGLEYYRLLGSVPGEWNKARAGLERLAAANRDNPRYQLALAKHLAEREESAAAAASMAHQLIVRDDVKASEVDDVLRQAVRRARGRVSAPAIAAYASRHPEDREILAAAQRRGYETEQSELLRSGALAQIEPDLQNAHAQELRARIASRSNETEAQTYDLIRSVQRESLGGSESTHDVTVAVRQLQLRAEQSLAAGELDPATVQLEAALALTNGRAEELIALARRAQVIDKNEAGMLLATASAVEPSSDWLFELYVRWLIDHEQSTEALDLLSQRALSKTWRASSRDTLQASALHARARLMMEHGDLVSARNDLETALRLAPRDVWIRYRLASVLRQQAEVARSKDVIDAGFALSSTAEMRYAAALHYSSIDQPQISFDLLDVIPRDERTDGMSRLHLSSRIAIARVEAVTLFGSGDHSAAARKLAAVEPLVIHDLLAARDLAYAWLAIDQSQHALTLVDAQAATNDAERIEQLLVRADVYNAADAEAALLQTLAELKSHSLEANQLTRVAGLERAIRFREVRGLQMRGQYAEARTRLQEMLRESPNDRRARVMAAEIELDAGNAAAASGLLSTLVAEDPDDVAVRLAYVRALTEAGDRSLAVTQLQAVRDRIGKTDFGSQMSVARRQLALRDFDGAANTYDAVLAVANDASLRSNVESARTSLDARLRSWLESGYQSTQKPGDDGISNYDAAVFTNVWHHAIDYGRFIDVHADLTSIDAGRLTRDVDAAALFGSTAAFNDLAERRYGNSAQDGIALGVKYATDAFSADIGTTPLGFRLTNVVGGVEWTPTWRSLDLALGLERRAVTSSVLSYGGMEDAATGREWGGVVETGPYLAVARYEARFSLSASVRYAALSGTNVADNNFFGARAATNLKVLEHSSFQAFVGATANYWSYDKNLQNYTFGNGGYYSPQSYLSIAIPLEIEGEYGGFAYRLRATLSHSSSEIDQAPFYPLDTNMMQSAAMMTLPPGYDAPYFDADRGSGFSVAGYAAVEREIVPNWVLGGKLDLDRADYYEPTTFMLYLRRGLGRISTRIEVPPRPPRPYND